MRRGWLILRESRSQNSNFGMANTTTGRARQTGWKVKSSEKPCAAVRTVGKVILVQLTVGWCPAASWRAISARRIRYVLRMMVVMWLAFFCTPHPFYLLIKGTLIVTHRFLDIEERTCSRREARKDERRLRVAWERLKSNLAGRRSGCDDIQCSLSERST